MDYAKGLSKHQHYVIRRHASRNVPGGRRLHFKQLTLAKVELFDLGKKLIGSRGNREAKVSLARFLGVGKELIDDMRRAFEDQSQDGHIDLGVDDDQDAKMAKKDEANVDEMIQHRKRGGSPKKDRTRSKTVPPSQEAVPAAPPEDDDDESSDGSTNCGRGCRGRAR